MEFFHHRCRPRLSVSARLISFLSLLLILFNTYEAQATHYRYGSITWNRVNDTTRTVTFTINQAWRRTFFTGAFPVTVGSTVDVQTPLVFGDATSANVILTVTSVNLAEDFFTGTATITHTYAGAATSFTASYSNCCRLSSLQNNADANFNSQTIVRLIPGSVASPVSTLPPIVNLPTGAAAATFNVPAIDPDGTALSYSLSTLAEFGGTTQPAGLSIHPSTGVATFNTVGKSVGQLYNGSFTITDASGAKTMTDFIIRIVNTSNPPVFNYAITPANNFAFNINPGQNLNFNVQASDADSGSTVSIQAAGLPAGVVFTPPLPTPATNPTTTNFSWTPTLAQLGTSVVTFVATDNFGIQTNTTVTINVNTDPVFIVPPTPLYNGDRLVLSGTTVTDTIAATNPNPAVATQLLSASLPPGATMSPALPTAFGPTATSVMSWSPTPADFGPHTLTFTAKDANNKTTTHQYILVANTPPNFISTPVLSIAACSPYSYNITIADPDLPYGDEMEIEHGPIPSWLTLTDNGDGTGSLTGTPTMAEVGIYNISLTAADIYHHGSPLVKQIFTITVTGDATPPVAACKPATVVLDNTGTAVVTAAMIDNGSGDACSGVASISVLPGSFSCFNRGANTVTLTVTDNAGNSSTCTATVTVVDNTPPTIICGANINVNTSGSCGANVTVPDPVAADNCSRTVTNSINNTSHASGFYPVGTTIIVWTVTDPSGNTNSCTQTVTVTDNEMPVLTCPAAVNRCVNGTGNYTIPVLTASDNCGVTDVSYLVSGATSRTGTGYDASGAFNVGNSHIIWLVRDAANNAVTCTTAVKINPLPTASITVDNNGSLCNNIELTAHSSTTENTYLWSNGEATQTIGLDGSDPDGVYKVFVTDLNGCTSAIPASYTYSKQNLLNSYTIYAMDRVDLGQYNDVQTGSVGVKESCGEARFDKNCSVDGPGAFVKAKDIDVKNPSSIPVRIYATANVPLPAMLPNTSGLLSGVAIVFNNQTTTLNGNYYSVTIGSNATVTLNGSSFGCISIGSGSKVTFTQANVNISRLITCDGTSIRNTEVRFSQNCNVRMDDDASIGERNLINPTGRQVTFYMNGACFPWGHAPEFSVQGDGTTINANILIPAGALDVKGGNSMCNLNGKFVATKVHTIKKYITWNNAICAAAPKMENEAQEQPDLMVAQHLQAIAAPNPSASHFVIATSTAETTPVTIRIVDMAGRVVEEVKDVLPNIQTTVGIKLPAGNYVAEITQGNMRETLKLVKIN